MSDETKAELLKNISNGLVCSWG